MVLAASGYYYHRVRIPSSGCFLVIVVLLSAVVFTSGAAGNNETTTTTIKTTSTRDGREYSVNNPSSSGNRTDHQVEIQLIPPERPKVTGSECSFNLIFKKLVVNLNFDFSAGSWKAIKIWSHPDSSASAKRVSSAHRCSISWLLLPVLIIFNGAF